MTPVSATCPDCKCSSWLHGPQGDLLRARGWLAKRVAHDDTWVFVGPAGEEICADGGAVRDAATPEAFSRLVWGEQAVAL